MAMMATGVHTNTYIPSHKTKQTTGDAVGACDSDSEIFRAKVAELEAALKEEKRTSAAALVKACAAEAEKAVASATAITTASEADSMRETIVELKSALAREKEKVSAAEAASAVAVAAVESEVRWSRRMAGGGREATLLQDGFDGIFCFSIKGFDQHAVGLFFYSLIYSITKPVSPRFIRKMG